MFHFFLVLKQGLDIHLTFFFLLVSLSDPLEWQILSRLKIMIKEEEKSDKYLDFAREMKKLRNKKMTVIPIVIAALGTFTKRWVQEVDDLEIRRQKKTTQTPGLLRSVRVLCRILETWCDLLPLRFQWKILS